MFQKIKNDFKLTPIDWALISISLLGIGLSSYFLIHSELIIRRFSSLQKGHVVIGSVKSTKNDVRRKVESSLLWFKVGHSDILYEGDSVFTGHKSATKFLLNSGVELTLQANSLVVLSTHEDQVYLDLQLGQFSARKVKLKTASRLERRRVKNIGGRQKASQKLGMINILQRGKVAQINLDKKSEIKVSKNKTGKLLLASKKGRANLKINNMTESFGEDEVLEIKNNFEIEKKKIEIKLLEPNDGGTVWVSQNESQTLKWSLKSKVSGVKYTVLISKDKDFNKILLNVDTEKNFFLVKNLVPGELYFWKVKAQHKQNKKDTYESLSYHFEVQSHGPLMTFFPTDQYEAELAEGEKTMGVQFYWEKRSELLSYQLQVSKDSSFQSLFLNQKLKSSEFFYGQFEVGKYYWRVKPYLSSLESQKFPWSEPIVFSIHSASPTPLAKEIQLPPVEEVPDSHSSVGGLFEAQKINPEVENMGLSQLNSNEDAFVTEKLPAPISIDIMKGKKQYKIELEQVVLRELSSVKNKILNPPVFQWKDKEVKNKENLNSKKLSSVDGVDGKQYVLQVSTDRKFQKIILNKQTQKKKFMWQRFGLDNYYWRVRSVAKNRLPSDWSKTRKLNIRMPSNVVEPLEKKVKVSSIKDYLSPAMVHLKWPPLPRVAKYEVQMLNKNKQLVKKYISPKNYAKVKVPLKETLYYKVQALNERSIPVNRPSPLASIRVVKSLKVDQPRLSIPSNAMELVSFEDEADPSQTQELLFRWRKVSQAKTYILEISKDKNFKENVDRFELSKTQYLLNKKLQGKYYWRVKALYEEFQSPWSRVRWFSL